MIYNMEFNRHIFVYMLILLTLCYHLFRVYASYDVYIFMHE